MSELKIHRMSQVVADLVDFMDAYQHDVMRVLFNLVMSGKSDAEAEFIHSFPHVATSLSEAATVKLRTKLLRAHGAVLDQFGHLSSRIRTGDWIEATYLPAGPDTFVVLTEAYDVKSLIAVVDGLSSSLQTTVLTSRYFVGPELELLARAGYEEQELVYIVGLVASGRPVTVEKGDGDEPTQQLRLQLLTEVRSLIHAKLHQIIYHTGENYALTGELADSFLTIRLCPHPDTPAF